MANRKFSAIAQSSVGPVNADFILGVRGGTTDVLFTHQQMGPHLDNNQNFFVSTTGSDVTGDGSAGNPWATPQHAYDTIVHYDLNGYNADIQIAAGSYVGVNATVSNNTGTISFVGAGVGLTTITPEASPNFGPFSFGNQQDINLTIFIQDLTLQGTGVEYGLAAGSAGVSVEFVGAIAFTNLTGCVVAFRDASVYLSTTSIQITGNQSAPFWVLDDASIQNWCTAYTLVGVPAWSNAFIVCSDNSRFDTDLVAIVWTGAATGKRFSVGTGGIIATGTNNLSYFPGNVAGDLLVGGQYDNYLGPQAPSVTFANLPPSPTAGMLYTVSNSSTTVWGNVIGGTGASTVLAFYNGANWTVAGK